LPPRPLLAIPLLWNAEDLGRQASLKDAVKLLDETLAEEKKTDDTLTKIAAHGVSFFACVPVNQ